MCLRGMSIGRLRRASGWHLSLSRVIVPLCEKYLVAKENMSEKRTGFPAVQGTSTSRNWVSDRSRLRSILDRFCVQLKDRDRDWVADSVAPCGLEGRQTKAKGLKVR